jgi:hypothetical protein
VPAVGFVASAGGHTYQRSPGIAIDPRDPDVRRWAATRSAATCTDLADVSVGVLCAAFADLYLWVHRPWSPVSSMSALERRQTKRSLTSIVSSAPARGRETRLAAVGFAFRSAGGFDVVAETLDEAEPFGSELLADAVQRCCGPLRDMPTPMLSSTVTSPIRTYSQCLTPSHTSPQTPSTSSRFSSGVVRPSRGSSRFQTLSASSSCNSISQSE